MLTPLRSLLTLIAICWASCSLAQIEKQAYALLLKRDFPAFAKFAAQYKEKKDQVTIDTGYNRDIIPGFQEAIFYLEKSIAQKSRICIVRKENSIIYCRVECYAINSKSIHAQDSTYEFADTAKMNLLKVAFQKNIGMPLNEKELFIDSIYYGKECSGASKSNPPAQDTIYKWVANLNMDGLKSWLQSTNTEKQVYALQGLNSLAAKGKPIPAELRKIIQVILQKNGTMNYCIQCGGGVSTIRWVITQAQLIYVWQKP